MKHLENKIIIEKILNQIEKDYDSDLVISWKKAFWRYSDGTDDVAHSRKVVPYKFERLRKNKIECLAYQLNRLLDEIVDLLDDYIEYGLEWEGDDLDKAIDSIIKDMRQCHDFSVFWKTWIYVVNYDVSQTGFKTDTKRILQGLWNRKN